MSATNASQGERPVSEAGQFASRLNWLRAGVMGANDGIVSTACVVLGVAGAAVGQAALFASAIAAVVAGALSMAVGEYVSVSTQRDSQQAALAREKLRLTTTEHRVADLAAIIHQRGIEPRLADQV